MKFMSKLYLGLGLVGILLITSCTKTEVKEEGNFLMKSMYDNVYHEWTSVFMEVERYAVNFRPCPAPRALAYMGYSAYEACIPGMSGYQSLQNRFGITDMPTKQSNMYWPEVINASYSYLMKKFFENATFKDRAGNILDKSQFLRIIDLKAKELKDKYLSQVDENKLNDSEAYGQQVAAAIWRFSSTDAVGHNAHLNPFPVQNNPQNTCDWVATDPQVSLRGMFPEWGKVRTFAAAHFDLDALTPPMQCNDDVNSTMYKQAIEMMDYTNQARNNSKGEMECIAEFWSDDRVGWTFGPATRLLAIADQIVKIENFDLEKTCVLYAQIGMALHDACVITWYNKYKYDLERPITYIHRNIDPNFTIPWLGFTPPFPAYPSDHSSFGYAGAGILEYFVGPNYLFTDHYHEHRTDFCGTPRSFTNLNNLAYENAFSGLPLGVHWRIDMVGGNSVGSLSAKRIHELPWKK